MLRFAYRLALRLGIWDVRGWLRQISARQLREWAVFHELEPFGEDRQDARFGSVVASIWNVNRNQKKHPTEYTVADGTLSGGDAVQRRTAKKTWQQMKMTMVMLSNMEWPDRPPKKKEA